MVLESQTKVEMRTLMTSQKPGIIESIPAIDMLAPDSEFLLVKACEEVGFFKVTGHGIPLEIMDRMEAEAEKFFTLPQLKKERATPFGYRNRSIGHRGDVGWIEYLICPTKVESISQISLGISKDSPEIFCSYAAHDYISSVKKLACQILELLAAGLKIQPRDSFSKLLMDEENDSVFRINYYPPCPENELLDSNMIGFGEHTDPQMLSVLRSNSTSGLEINLRDGSWVSVPSDESSFYVIVGDIFQVMTNGRFRSAKHRVLTSSTRTRVSMIFFGAPALKQRIAPFPELLVEGEVSLYKEFSWSEYKCSAQKTILAEDRLQLFMANKAVTN